MQQRQCDFQIGVILTHHEMNIRSNVRREKLPTRVERQESKLDSINSFEIFAYPVNVESHLRQPREGFLLGCVCVVHSHRQYRLLGEKKRSNKLANSQAGIAYVVRPGHICWWVQSPCLALQCLCTWLIGTWWQTNWQGRPPELEYETGIHSHSGIEQIYQSQYSNSFTVSHHENQIPRIQPTLQKSNSQLITPQTMRYLFRSSVGQVMGYQPECDSAPVWATAPYLRTRSVQADLHRKKWQIRIGRPSEWEKRTMQTTPVSLDTA